MTKYFRVLLALFTIGLTAQTQASIDFNVGCWDLSFSGYVNGFYTYSMCDSEEDIAGGLTCPGDKNWSAIRGGFVPSAFIFSATTTECCYDIGFTFGMYPSINNEPRLNVNRTNWNEALGSGSLDFRQIFMTIGNDCIGTFKVGRDIAFFSKYALLYEMSFPAVGGNVSVAAPVNTSLGRIGLGYIYPDWMAQISYFTPECRGFQGYIGIFQPLDAISSLEDADDADSFVSGFARHHSSPQFQAGFIYKWEKCMSCSDKPVLGEVWGDAFYQHQGEFDSDDEHDFDAYGFDGGFKFTFNCFDLVGYAYWGEGLGTTGWFIDAISLDGEERESYGGYIQGVYTYCNTRFGLSWGFCGLGHEDGDSDLLVRRNEATIFGIYHQFTKSVQLCFEYVYVEATNHDGDKNHENSLIAGAFLTY